MKKKGGLKMIDYAMIDTWLHSAAQIVDETGIDTALQHLVMRHGLADVASICVIYALSADGYAPPQQVGTMSGSPETIREELKKICGISQRGLEARFGYFHLMFTPSPAEAEAIVDAIRLKLGIQGD